MLIVLASPVWDYFAGGMKPLRIIVEDQRHRTASTSASSRPVATTRRDVAHAVGKKTSTRSTRCCSARAARCRRPGAANFLLIREGHILTRSLDTTFLHGVTRDSLLDDGARQWASRSRSACSTSREMLEWARTGEAALSGTAAVLAGVGTFVLRDGTEVRVRQW
jgi:branched-chain amino acid aminotransferase